MPKVKKFKYLTSTVQESGGCERKEEKREAEKKISRCSEGRYGES